VSTPMHVLEVRNAELMESITKQAAEGGISYAAIVALIGAVDSFTVMAVQGDPTVGGHLHEAQLETSFARAYVIPSEYHVAIPDGEQIVYAEAPDSPRDRGRLTDTRVGLP
jgi:uncharacterized protein